MPPPLLASTKPVRSVPFCRPAQTERGITTEVVGKQPGQHTFVAAPRRWVVERTLANLGRECRLSKDYERHDLFSECVVCLASISSLLRRLLPSAITATRYYAVGPLHERLEGLMPSVEVPTLLRLRWESGQEILGQRS